MDKSQMVIAIIFLSKHQNYTYYRVQCGTYTNFFIISSLSVAEISMLLFSFISIGNQGLIRAPERERSNNINSRKSIFISIIFIFIFDFLFILIFCPCHSFFYPFLMFFSRRLFFPSLLLFRRRSTMRM